MGTKTHRFRVAEARRVKHPINPRIERHYFLVRAREMPQGVSTDANAREPAGINRQVYRDVRDSLLGLTATPGTFDLMNKGITILARDVKRIDDDSYDVVIGDGQGIVDGGHTYRIICENQDNDELPGEQFVEVQVRTGIDGDLITDIAKGLNTGIQVKLHSLANLDGAFEWLKEEVANEPYANLISWREGDEGEYDVRDLISVLEAFNVFDFPNNKSTHPIHAYEKWSLSAKKFATDYQEYRDSVKKSKYHRLRPLLKGALVLFDTIRREFREIHNELGGRAGKLKIMEEAPKGRNFTFPFAGLQPSNYRLTKGALYPILAAFRNAVKVDSRTNTAQWIDGPDGVRKLWQDAGPQLVSETANATEDIGRLPDQLGKNRGHWANLHKTLELWMLRREISNRRR